MSYDVWKSYSRAPLAVRAGVALAITLAFLVIPAMGDQWAYSHLYIAKVYDRDWAMALRAAGTLYVWIPVALIFWLVQREQNAPAAKRRALLVLGSPVLAEEPDAIEEIYEPFLMQIGFLNRTPRGRVATQLAYEYFKITPTRRQSSLF